MNQLQKVKDLPVSPKALAAAVGQFVEDSDQYHVPHDKGGLYKQTIESIATTLNAKGDESRQLWLAWEGDEVMAYVMTSIQKDIDDSLTYWMTQAWVSPKVRGLSIVKSWYRLLLDEARRRFCRHVLVVSSRNTQAYLRFLGAEWHVYCTLIKCDLEN